MSSLPTQAVARVALPCTLMVAAAVLVKGYSDTGDGFAAGVIVVLGVVLEYLAFGVDETERRLPIRHAGKVAVAGLLITLAVAFAPVVLGRPLLTHAPGPNEHVVHLGTLELMTPVLFDVGVFLLVVGALLTAVRLLALAQVEHPEAEAV